MIIIFIYLVVVFILLKLLFYIYEYILKRGKVKGCENILISIFINI